MALRVRREEQGFGRASAEIISRSTACATEGSTLYGICTLERVSLQPWQPAAALQLRQP